MRIQVIALAVLMAAVATQVQARSTSVAARLMRDPRLALTEEQRLEIRGLLETAEIRRVESRAELEKQEIGLRRLVRGECSTRDLERKVDQLSRARADLLKQELVLSMEIRQLLDDRQKRIFDRHKHRLRAARPQGLRERARGPGHCDARRPGAFRPPPPARHPPRPPRPVERHLRRHHGYCY